jgi:hypothetical protein
MFTLFASNNTGTNAACIRNWECGCRMRLSVCPEHFMSVVLCPVLQTSFMLCYIFTHVTGVEVSVCKLCHSVHYLQNECSTSCWAIEFGEWAQFTNEAVAWNLRYTHNKPYMAVKFQPWTCYPQTRFAIKKWTKQTPWLLVCNLIIPTNLPLLVGEIVSTFAARWCRMVSAPGPHGR